MSAPTAPALPLRAGRRLVPLVVAVGPGTGQATPTDLPSLSGRVVIISATVGQGHEGAARELASRLTRRGVDVQVHDYLDALPAYARRMLRDLYAPTVQYAPALFDRMFAGLEHDGVLRRTASWVCDMALAGVEEWSRGADVVVTTYPLAGQTLGALREQNRLPAPAVTYLTDPAAHATWCHPAVDHHLTVTRATASDAARYGVRARASGPLCARTTAQRDRHAVRDELGLAHHAPVALISAGSLGMGAVPRTVHDLMGHPDLRVVVLCGRNARLRRRLSRLPRVVALGWRDDVPSLMAASDVLVHNAGGLSLTEALAAGLPAITYRPIAGHGRANAEVLDRAGVAPWARDAAALTAAVEDVVARESRVPGDELWPAGSDPAAAVHGILAAELSPSLRSRTQPSDGHR
jgi:processive 1,2-diacylglycerol beta-glucosyltransferase